MAKPMESPLAPAPNLAARPKPKRKLPRYTLAASAAALLAFTLGLFYLHSELILRRLNALQGTYRSGMLFAECAPPEWLPSFLNRQIEHYAERSHDDNWMHARDLRNRIYLCLGAPVPDLFLLSVESIEPGFKEALIQLSRATTVSIEFSPQSDTLTQRNARIVCEVLSQMPNLQRVALSGPHFTATALSPLSGHLKVKELHLPLDQLTPDSIPLLLSLPPQNSHPEAPHHPHPAARGGHHRPPKGPGAAGEGAGVVGGLNHRIPAIPLVISGDCRPLAKQD